VLSDKTLATKLRQTHAIKYQYMLKSHIRWSTKAILRTWEIIALHVQLKSVYLPSAFIHTFIRSASGHVVLSDIS